MANFLYNGMELPNIDAVWTDKTAYPYAIITSFDAALVGYSGSSTIYLLDASGVAHYNNNGVCYKNPPYLSCSWFCSYDPDVCSYLSGMGLPITVGEWGGSSPSDIGSGSAQSVVGTVFWSNADILNTDGSVYLAASTPIRVGSKLNISIAVNHETDLYFYGQSDTMHKLPMDDAATLPYVTILEPKGMHGTYYAYFTAVQFTGKTGRIWLETESNYAEWYYSDGTWNRTATGHFAANTGFTLNSGSGQVYNRVWHNYDMMTEKGELAWKVGVFVREYVYNGITVPNSLPAHDAAMYPYEILTTSVGTIPNHYYVTDTKAMTDESGNVIIPSNTKYQIYTFNLNAFCFDSGTMITTTEAVTISSSSEILAWTNHDVLNTDGTVFFAAPDLKVPSGLTWNAVDGYLDTGTFMEMPCYKMFNEIPIYDDLLQGTLSIGAGGNQTSMPLSEEGMLFEEEGLLVIAETLFVVPNEVAPSMGLPSGGVWAVGDLSAAGIESLTLDYPNAPSAGSAGLTNTTALVYFNCNDLNSTEPIDSIHAWVYKKSDGLNTTISPTWTSELFKAPSYSTSHTFTGLTPNTEYEVYGCIFVNGEATDHNAIASFITLEGGGGGTDPDIPDPDIPDPDIPDPDKPDPDKPDEPDEPEVPVTETTYFYIGDENSKAGKVKVCFLGINNVARKIKKGYIGDKDGLARMIFQGAIPLANLPVGSSVFMNMNGTPTEFLIVHQGLPDATMYDTSCDGTWLLMKNVYGEDMMFGTNVDDFQSSDVRLELNDVIYFAFDTAVQNIIKQVKIPSFKGSNSTGSVAYGANGLPSKLFLLSGYEIGWTNANGNFPAEGVVLDYFKGCATKDPKRIAYYNNGDQACWWLRSPVITSYKKAWSTWDGEAWAENFTTLCSIRPALILPKTTVVDDKFNVIV